MSAWSWGKIDWSATAAMVQAIGSLIGLGIAIWIPFAIAEKAAQAQQEDARRRARLNVPLVQRLLSDFAAVIEHHRGVMVAGPINDWTRYVGQTPSILLGCVPPSRADWDRLRPELHYFEPFADRLINLEVEREELLRTMAGLVERIAADRTLPSPGDEARALLLAHLDVLRKLIDDLHEFRRG